jgi:hypothetical protein
VTFSGNLTANPQTIFLSTPASCEATDEQLVEMLSQALIAFLEENSQTIENLEGFNIEAAGGLSIRVDPPGCVVDFHGPAIES